MHKIVYKMGGRNDFFQMLDGELKAPTHLDTEKLLHRAEAVWLTTAHARIEQLHSDILLQRLPVFACGRR